MSPAEHRFATIFGVIVIVAIIDFLIRTHIEETRRQRQYNKDVRGIWERREVGGNHPGPLNPTPPPTGPVDIGPRRGGRSDGKRSAKHREKYSQSPVRDPYRVPAGPPKTESGVSAKPDVQFAGICNTWIVRGQPFILDNKTAEYMPAIPYLQSWAERERQAAEDRRAKAVRRGDQRDQRMAIGARDALGDVLRDLNRVEYK
jgi:hypothetical protein